MNTYKTLPVRSLRPGAGVHQSPLAAPRPVLLGSPAVEVMTDLKQVAAATITGEVGLDEANQAMIARGVRSLLVVDHLGTVIGLVTARDLKGERPLQCVQRQGVKHQDLRVRDIMTHWERIEVFALADVLRANVGQVLEALKAAGRQHALVVDDGDAGGDTARQMVRGVFSASQIARQLGIPVHTTELAKTFAEIETVMMGSEIS